MANIINASFDPAYLIVVEGGIDRTTELLACRYDKIFFTGSTTVGRIVAKAAAEHLTPVALELGGKSPCIVLADADIAMAAKRIVWGKYLNAGQTCIAPDYVLAERSIYEALLVEMKKQIPQIVGSDPLNSDSYVRIINTRNLERIERMIDPAKLYVGGNVIRSKNYIEPTILRDVTFDDLIMQEEIFGPLMPVLPFDDLGNVIRQIKDRPKPLSLYLFTRDTAKQHIVLDQVPFGGGCINDVIMHVTNARLPFGGVGDSGIGSYHSVAGSNAFSHFKSVLNKPFWFEAAVKYAPHTDRKLKLLKWAFEG